MLIDLKGEGRGPLDKDRGLLMDLVRDLTGQRREQEEQKKMTVVLLLLGKYLPDD